MELRLLSIAWIMLLLAHIFPPRVLAHGVEGTVQPGGLAVSFQYSSGEAMSYAKVNVLTPAPPQTYQVGHTDKNGRFCFYPDTPGDWRVSADDGMGHRLEVKVPVTDPSTLKSTPPAGAATVAAGKSVKILTGLSVIFSLSGLLFWLQGSKLRRAGKQPRG